MAGKRRGRGEGSIERLKSGSHRADISITDGEGKRHHVRRTFKTKGEAIAWRNQKIAELGRSGGARPGHAGAMTVGEWLTRWLTLAKADLAPATVKRYESALPDIRSTLEAKPLRLLQRKDVKEWMQCLRDGGRPEGEVRYALVVLKAALSRAAEDELIAESPAAGIKRPKGRAKRKQQPLDRAGCAAVIEAARAQGMEAWFRLGVDAGVRPSEGLALRWCDLDFARGTVHVQRNLCGVTRREKPPKTPTGIRKVPISPGTLAALAAHLGHQQAEAWHDAKQGLVFPDAAGQHQRYKALRWAFSRVARAACLPRVMPYDLRHTCATLLLSAGVSLRVVADRLGHSSPTVTLKHYAHALAGQQEAAAEQMQKILPGGSPAPAPRKRANASK